MDVPLTIREPLIEIEPFRMAESGESATSAASISRNVCRIRLEVSTSP
jgi:hypothetical protein